MTDNLQQQSHSQEILLHTTQHPNRYHKYKMTLMQTPVHNILACWNHLTLMTPSILNEDDVRAGNVGVKGITMTVLKARQSYSQSN